MKGEGLSALRELVVPRLAELSQSVFVDALRQGNLSEQRYATFLRALDHVWEALEGVAQPPFKTEVGRLRAALAKDLEGADGLGSAPDLALLYGVLWAQEARLRATQDADLIWVDLLVLAECFPRAIGDRFKVPSGAHRLAGSYLHLLRGAFGDLTAGAILSASLRPSVYAAMGRAVGICDALSADESPRLEGQVALLNPEAGRHPIPEDVREVQVALRAGDLSIQDFPYMDARYGTRGRRFTRSDSAWLVTLSGHEPYAVHKHVGWLGRVLAMRGMPRVLLERHLLVLHRELVRALPQGAPRYARLVEASEQLAEARRGSLSDSHLDKLERLFVEQAGDAHKALQRGVGALIGSAFADEADGLDGTVKSLMRFLEDEARFDARFVDAARHTAKAARVLCR